MTSNSPWLSLPLALSMCVSAGACGGPSPQSSLADAIEDRLICDDVARPSTIRRMREALEHPSLQTVQAAVLAPEDLAGVVAIAPQLEGAVVAVRNIAAVVDAAVAQDVLHDGWDGVRCGEVVAVQCTAGAGESVVECDAAGTITAVEHTFQGCVFRGIKLDGGTRVTPGPSRDTDLIVELKGLDLDERHRVDGTLMVPRSKDTSGGSDVAADAVVAHVVTPLTLNRYGGVDGASCGMSLSLDVLTVSRSDAGQHINIEGSYASRERRAGVKSGVDGVTLAAGCACPTPGSSVSFEVPRPLGRDGDTAIAQVDWGRADDADHCASVDVDIVDWPAECVGLEHVGSDCGQDAVRASMQAALHAMCFRPR